MTSWSVVRSISAMRSTSTLAARLDGRERVGRDLAAPGLGAGDRELDAEHRLEARLVGPDRAHLGQRVAPDHAPRPGRGDRDPADVVAALAAVEGHDARRPRRRRRAAASRSAPRPTTVRTRPPAVRPCRRHPTVVPAWNTSAPAVRGGVQPVDRVAAPRRVRVAGRGQHDPDGRAGQRRQGSISVGRASRPRAAASSNGPSGAGQARQEDLRLRVAEARVALEQTGAVGGQHQAGVQRAPERRAAAGQLGEDRPWKRVDEVGGRVVGQVRQRASTAPMPPVFGPLSPSSRRLWSRASGQRDGPRRRRTGR